MLIKYLGPSDSVNVAPFGPHGKGEVKDYPDGFGKELLATSQKQQFEVDAATEPKTKNTKSKKQPVTRNP